MKSSNIQSNKYHQREYKMKRFYYSPTIGVLDTYLFKYSLTYLNNKSVRGLNNIHRMYLGTVYIGLIKNASVQNQVIKYEQHV